VREIVSVEQMRRMDAAEIERGTSAAELMRRAGEAVFQAYPWRDGACIACGGGNNGGDGLVLALCLQKAGIQCRLLLTEEPKTETARGYFLACKEQGIPWKLFNGSEDFSKDSAIADCLLGTGFRGEPRGEAERLIREINQSGLPVVSVDVNSGQNGDSGLGKTAVRSQLTVAVGSLKYGHFLGDAKDLIGSLHCADIGIPLLPERNARLIEQKDCAALFPERLQNSHKGSYGYVALLGGCIEYAGAAKLANLSCAALRSGCGVATLAVPQGIAASVSPYLLESTLFPLLDDGNGHAVYNEAQLEELIQGKKAIGVGMGWGRSADNPQILSYLLERAEIPLLIDADGLNTLSKMDAEKLRHRSAPTILTPHPKELERLSGISVAQICSDPVGVAEDYARRNGVILLLKGACTVVTDGENTYLVNRGCAGMATAGSGDVLSGVLTGLLGYAEPTAKTVACGAYLTGLAGELAEQAGTPISMLASDTVAQLPGAIKLIMKP